MSVWHWDMVIWLVKGKLSQDGLSPADRRFLNNLLRLAEDGKDISSEEITRAKNIGVRNPAFPGDMVGYPDDDFDDDDEDEDNPNRYRPNKGR